MRPVAKASALHRVLFACVLAATLAALPIALSSCVNFGSGSGANGQPGVSQESISVTVSVSAPGVEGFQPASVTCTVSAGSSVYDAMCASGIEFTKQDSATYGVFIDSIQGISNGKNGPSSGWIYTVNGDYPFNSCGNHVVASGDVIEWSFVS